MCIVEEFYFFVLFDCVNCFYLSLCLVEGGMEIEEFVVECFEVFVCVEVNLFMGIDKEKVVEIVCVVNFFEDLIEKVFDVFVKFYDVYKGEDVMFVEVNLFVCIEEGDIIVFDGKVMFDDNVFEICYLEYEVFEDKDVVDLFEVKVKVFGFNYVKFDGEVGIIGNGVGFVMFMFDVVVYVGENYNGVKFVNFFDIGGGVLVEVMVVGFDVIFGDL